MPAFLSLPERPLGQFAFLKDRMSNSTETPISDPATGMACLIVRTGRDGCYAHFYPALYQLTLITGGVEKKVDLGYSGSRLLERLLQQPGEVVSRDELMNHAWADRIVGQGSLNQQIYTLRQVLGDEKSREIIQTLPRRGYLLNPGYLVFPVAIKESAESEQATLAATPPRSFLRHHGRQRPFWLALLGSLCLLGIALFGYLYHLSRPISLHSSEMQLGSLLVRYIDQDAGHLQPLILQTHGLTSRLAGLAQHRGELVVSLRGGFYELLCLQDGGSARSLMIHESQLSSIADAQLERCLP